MRHLFVFATAVGMIISAEGFAAEVTLTLQHFASPKAPAHARFLAPWAERIQAESDGRIEVEIFPSMSLGGKPPELYSQVRDGVVDLIWTVTAYTPGVFPRAEVFELPTVHQSSAEATNQAIQDLYDAHLAADFAAIHPILVHVHTGQAIHMVDRPVKAIEDLAGLKIRIPSRTGAWLIQAWGAEPVGMPVPELPQALSKGTIDGTLVPYEIVIPLKVHEMTQYSVEGPGATRFGTATFLFAMNKERYESLPDDLKSVIDNNSGRALAAEIGRVWDSIEPDGRALTAATGSIISELSSDAMAAFDARADEVVAKWIDDVATDGIDGVALVAAARAAIAKYEKNSD